MRYFVQIFRIFHIFHELSNDRNLNVDILNVLKIAISRSGLLINREKAIIIQRQIQRGFRGFAKPCRSLAICFFSFFVRNAVNDSILLSLLSM